MRSNLHGARLLTKLKIGVSVVGICVRRTMSKHSAFHEAKATSQLLFYPQAGLSAATPRAAQFPDVGSVGTISIVAVATLKHVMR